jgi:hypothetical protein
MENSYGLKRKGVDPSQGPPKRNRDVVPILAAIETPLVLAENAPSSSGWHSNVVLLLNLMMSFLCTVLCWAFPSYTLKFHFYFLLLNFVWVLKIFLDPCNHDSLLSSQSIRRRRFSSDFELPMNNFTIIPFSH